MKTPLHPATIQTVKRDAWRIVDTGRPYHYGVIRGIKIGKARAVVLGTERRFVLICSAMMHVVDSPAINAAIRDKVHDRPSYERSLAWPSHERNQTP